MTQSLPKLRGNRPGVVAALFTILLFIAGCGGSSKTATPTPTFTPPAGSYSAAQNVTVSDTNQSAILYCTNNGSTPTASSPQCANPITVSQSETINAIAITPGMAPSAVATAQYTIASTAAAPTVTGIGPATGPPAGGTSVTIIGTNFTGATAVDFGTLPATSMTVNSATSITAVSPAGAGTVNVTVVTAAGTSATNNADLFTYAIPPTPAITDLTPNTGMVGTSVAIIGTNFGSLQGTSTVTFAGTPATSISLWSDTSIVAVVPAGATSGNVIVTVGGVASAGAPFTVTIPAPTISQLTPNSGAVGTSVAIIGTNFGAAQGTSTVTFNGTAASSITSWSPTAIVTLVPTGATTGNVVVTVGGIASAGVPFTVTIPTPSITSLSPTSGKVGDSITITGANFGSSQGTSTVTFNGTTTTPTSWSSTSIVTTVPAGATTGNVVVTVNGNTSNGVAFTVNNATITGLNPTSGAVGSPVTISGTNFGSAQGSATVTFNGTTATATSWSNTSIVVTVPSGATTGNVVVTANGAPSNGVSFTVLPTPSIAQLNPASGTVSSSVTITGTNFGSSQGSSTVTFSGTAATPTSWSNTQIVVTVPTGAATGNVVVTVGGVASAGSPFTVLPTPTISSLSTNTGAVGATVTITGTNFGSSQGSSTVKFNGTAATPTSWSDTQIVVTVPTGATTGNLVVTVIGVSSAGTPFTVPGSPEIDNLSPAYGLPGSTVTIAGQNFGTATGTVSFNGTPASVGTWSASSIVVTVPAGATTGNVTVTAEGVTTNGLLFTITPTITRLSPTSAPVNAQVTITGTSFGANQGSSTVTFPGTTTTASINNWSDTSIVALVPSGAAGSGNVVVTVNGAPSTGSPFTVLPPPAITNLSPSIATPGGPDFTLAINGSNFDSTAVVNFGGTQLTPTNITPSQITVTVPAAQIAAVGTPEVMVTEDDGSSNSETFTIATYIGGTVVSGPASGGAPIGATVQLYAAGTTGYGTGTSGPQKIGNAVQADATTGAYYVTYDCSALTAGGDQLYLVATGNTSGVVLMSALGSCSALTSGATVTINEATTIASAYALSAFASNASSGIDIGTPVTASTCTATNTDANGNLRPWQSSGPSTCNYIGLQNAFATVNNLVDLPSGTVLSVTPYYKNNPGAGAGSNISQVPQARINTLANILATCVDAAGNCAVLSDLTGSSADTLQSALYIAQHPGKWSGTTGTASLYNLVANPAEHFTPPYGNGTTTLSAEPNDWALAIIYQGAGLSNAASPTEPQPTGMAIDGEGNIWVTVQNTATLPSGSGTESGGLVAVFSNQGTPVSPSATSATNIGGYASGGIVEPQAIAIDQNGYAWIGNYAPNGSTQGSITVLDKTGTPQYGTSTPYTPALMLIPNTYGIAVDASNNVWVSSNTGPGPNGVCGGNTGSGPWGGSILGLNGSGSAINGNSIVADYLSNNSTCPTFLNIDQNGNMWTYDDGDYTRDIPGESLSLFSTSNGSLQGGPYFNMTPFAGPMAFDSAGNAWSNEEFAGPVMTKMQNFAGSVGDGSTSVGPDPTVYGISSSVGAFSGRLVAVDGAGRVWTAGNLVLSTGAYGALFTVNSSDNGLLSPAGGYLGFDGSGLAPIQINIYTGGGAAVDNSGNVWVVGQAVSYPGSNDQGAELTEFVGIGVPAPAPLVSGLINGNKPGTRP